MSDPTMEDIKNGRGLKPLQSTGQSPEKQPGVTTEQKSYHGVTNWHFTKNPDKAEDK